ncbi:hypothetical protein [Novosphingobium sp.]|uniref:hypothetical protein n=1 Tax=Novosphingobium sp. TaxID=1874826 RepID=UPI0033411069
MILLKTPLLTISVAAAAAYGLYRCVTFRRGADAAPPPSAFATGESTPGAVNVRNAGPDAMAGDQPHWDKVDQASDESYPASDPPGSNRFT